MLKHNFVPKVEKKMTNKTTPQTSCPLGISFCFKGRKKAQLCADELENFMNTEEIHMPLQINHQQGKVFILSVRFCGKFALLALKPKEVIYQSTFTYPKKKNRQSQFWKK